MIISFLKDYIPESYILIQNHKILEYFINWEFCSSNKCVFDLIIITLCLFFKWILRFFIIIERFTAKSIIKFDYDLLSVNRENSRA